MSASTRSRALEAAAFAFVMTAFAAITTTQVSAQAPAEAAVRPTLPETVRALLPGSELHGQGDMTWFGLSVYQARLWSPPGGWRPDGQFVLDIRYARSIKGEQLAARSIEEMLHIKAGTAAQHQQWREAMQKVFPDVTSGDRLIGVAVPGAPTKFFINGKPLGEIGDPAFGPAFFGIWLSPATSRPDLRRMLLGMGK